MGRKTGSMLLAAALAAPVWVWPCQAQAQLHSMDEGPLPPLLEAPEGRDKDGTAERPLAAGTDGAVRVRAKALAEMERLRDEIQTLAAVRGAQAALLAWNRERARTGAPPAALSTAPCRDAALEPWCRLLPATFGNDVSGGTSGGDGR